MSDDVYSVLELVSCRTSLTYLNIIRKKKEFIETSVTAFVLLCFCPLKQASDRIFLVQVNKHDYDKYTPERLIRFSK